MYNNVKLHMEFTIIPPAICDRSVRSVDHPVPSQTLLKPRTLVIAVALAFVCICRIARLIRCHAFSQIRVVSF
jgi:hypothetical protein